MTNTNIFSDIDKALDDYFSMSDSLLNKGIHWAVVVSFHEVYRYLYPTEPYINNYSVPDEEKPQFLLDIINKQINLYSSIEMAVSPYENMISGKIENLLDEKARYMVENGEVSGCLMGCMINDIADSYEEHASEELYIELKEYFVNEEFPEESVREHPLKKIKQFLYKRDNMYMLILIVLIIISVMQFIMMMNIQKNIKKQIILQATPEILLETSNTN